MSTDNSSDYTSSRPRNTPNQKSILLTTWRGKKSKMPRLRMNKTEDIGSPTYIVNATIYIVVSFIICIILSLWYVRAKFGFGQINPSSGVLDKLDITLLLKFHQTISLFATRLTISPTKSDTTVDDGATIRDKILAIVQQKLLNITDTTPVIDLVNNLLLAVNSETAGQLLTNITLPPEADENELKFTQLYRKTDDTKPTTIIDKFLFDIFYPTYKLIFTNSGSCFFFDKIKGKAPPGASAPGEAPSKEAYFYEKPLLIQNWINKLLLSTELNSTPGQLSIIQHFYITSSYATKMALNTITFWDGYKPDANSMFLYSSSIILVPIILIFTIILSVFYVIVFSYYLYVNAISRKGMITDNSIARAVLIWSGLPAVFFHCIFFIKYLFIDCMVDLFEYDNVDGFVTNYSLGGLVWDIAASIPSAFILFIYFGYLLSVVLMLRFTVVFDKIGIVVIVPTILIFIIIFTHSQFHEKLTPCKNGWFDPAIKFYENTCPKKLGVGETTSAVATATRLLLSDETPFTSITPTDRWFSLFPSVSVGNIIPYNMTEMRILDVVSLLPSPLPKWITISDPIHANKISQKIPVLLDKLKLIYVGLQQILTTYNDGSIMINDLIADVHDTIDATKSTSPASIESDMQIRETLSLLFNLLNLYLVTHWYYSNQTEMTTFIFNVRNNLILIHRSISLEAEDIRILDNKKFIDDIVDTVNTVFIKERVFPKSPIILPDNVYETYRKVASPITTQMPWLLPKLKIVFEYIPYIKHQTMLGNPVSPYKEAELINRLKTSKSIEIDDFYLDYTCSAILRNINTYLLEYINKWLTKGSSSGTITSFDIETYSYKYARRFFVIAYRVRYLYNILTTYQGVYDKKVIDNIRKNAENILADMDAANMIKDDAPVPTTHAKIPSNITIDSIIDILAILEPVIKKNTPVNKVKEVDEKYKRLVDALNKQMYKSNDAIEAALIALKSNTSPSPSTIKDIKDSIEAISNKILDNSNSSREVVRAIFDWRLKCEDKIKGIEQLINTTNPSFKSESKTNSPSSKPTPPSAAVTPPTPPAPYSQPQSASPVTRGPPPSTPQPPPNPQVPSGPPPSTPQSTTTPNKTI